MFENLECLSLVGLSSPSLIVMGKTKTLPLKGASLR
jgi:hypothetical protein